MHINDTPNVGKAPGKTVGKALGKAPAEKGVQAFRVSRETVRELGKTSAERRGQTSGLQRFERALSRKAPAISGKRKPQSRKFSQPFSPQASSANGTQGLLTLTLALACAAAFVLLALFGCSPAATSGNAQSAAGGGTAQTDEATGEDVTANGDGTAQTDEATGEESAWIAVPAADAQAVAITESGWWAKDSYAHFGVMLENPNKEYAAHNTRILVKLYDKDGSAISSEEFTVALIGPNVRIGFAGTAGNGWSPSKVSIEVVEGSTQWQSAKSYQAPFSIESFSEEDKLYFRYEITGKIKNLTGSYASTADLSLILRDESGSIVAGYTGSAYRIKADRVKDFLVTMHSAPEHALVEVYAQPVEE